jgi:hypothetical protein
LWGDINQLGTGFRVPGLQRETAIANTSQESGKNIHPREQYKRAHDNHSQLGTPEIRVVGLDGVIPYPPAN